MATNEILAFAATDTGTNLLTQAEYLADAQRPIGNQPGVARSKLINKSLRQSSLLAAGLAQFLSDNQATNLTDGLIPSQISAMMSAVVRSLGIPNAISGGTADAITANFSTDVALTNGLTVIVRGGLANATSTPTFSPDGLTPKLIVKGNNLALVAGDIAGAGHWLEMQFDAVLDKWVLQNPARGVAISSDALKANLAGATFTGPITYLGAGAITSNTALGLNALSANTTGIQATASGVNALSANTTGSNNTATGYSALNSNTTGINNTASGVNALTANTTGSNNTASGFRALSANTTGIYNTANGLNALYNNTTGNYNTASGVSALSANTTGNNNTATGLSALYYSTTGNNNTSTGFSALYNNTTGSNNTAIGIYALQDNTTGSGNTAINPLGSAGAYQPVFNPVAENNRFCMGSTAITHAYISVAWTVVSDARDKINFAPVPHGLEFVKLLKPISYQFRTTRDSDETNGPVRYGFKAQDVLALEGENPVIVDNEDAEKLRMIDTALIPVLVNALQELSEKFDAYVASHP